MQDGKSETTDDNPWMETMKKYHTRRKRRASKAILAFGTAAKRAHKRVGGRTGQIHQKSTKGRGDRYVTRTPNPPHGIFPVGV